MKIRNSFVSNSSSCSFIVPKKCFKDQEQIDFLRKKYIFFKSAGYINDDKKMYFRETSKTVRFNCYHGQIHVTQILDEFGIKETDCKFIQG